MMWPSKVRRSTIAAQRRGSVKVCCHSENGALEAIAMARRSSRSVKIWNRSFAPVAVEFEVAELVEAEQVDLAVAGDGLGRGVCSSAASTSSLTRLAVVV